jgi:hypothetical protein
MPPLRLQPRNCQLPRRPGASSYPRLPRAGTDDTAAQRRVSAAGLRPGPAGRRERPAKRAALKTYRKFEQDREPTGLRTARRTNRDSG